MIRLRDTTRLSHNFKFVVQVVAGRGDFRKFLLKLSSPFRVRVSKPTTGDKIKHLYSAFGSLLAIMTLDESEL